MVAYSNFSENILKKMLKDPDEFDKMPLKDEWDSSLSLAENLTNLKEKFPGAFKEEIDIEKMQHEIQECFKREQEALELMEKESIKQIEESITPRIERFYKTLHEYIKMVIEGFTDSLIICGPVGIGKTFQILNTLEKSGKPYVYHSGHRTPLRLFEFLYQHRDGYIIFMDDTAGLLREKETMDILLPGLWSTTGVRKISWFTSSPKINVPPSFVFTSRIIFTINRMPKEPWLKSVFDRCLVYKLSFDYKTLLKIMAEICKVKHPKLTREERFKILKFIRSHTSTATKNFNLRLQKKCEDCYIYAREHGKDFKELALPLLEADKNVILVQELMHSGKSIKEQIKEFREKSGKSRSTFYRIREKLELED